jgi:hypothetical protein
MTGNEPWQAPMLEGPLCKPRSSAVRVFEDDLRDLAENETSLSLMQEIYRSAKYPPHMRMRAAQIAIAYEHPKLRVTAALDGSGFAEEMREIARRSGGSNVIDAKAQHVIEAPRPIPQLTEAGTMPRPPSFRRRM